MTIIEEMHRDPAAFVERVRQEPSLASFIDDKGSTILHHAVVYPAVVTALLEAGADPNRPDAAGNTAVHLAGRWCALDTLRSLVAAGGNSSTPDADGSTPLYWAVERGRDDVARFLRGEPQVEFEYIPPPKPPAERVRFGRGVSTVATRLVLIAAWVGFAALRAGLRYRSERIALEQRGVVVDGKIVDYQLTTIGHNRRISVYRPIVTYMIDGREYKRYSDRGYELGHVPPEGSVVKVRHLPDKPEVARVVDMDSDEWFLLALFGFFPFTVPLSALIFGLVRGHLFATETTG